MVENILIPKKQTLDILSYELEILPALIPNNFILFRYNRLINYHDLNIIKEIKMKRCNKWSNEELFKLLIKSIETFNLKCIISNNIYIKEIPKFKKVKSSVIRSFIKYCPLWAINHQTILKIPAQLDQDIRNIKLKSKEEYILNLVQNSYAIRVFLLQNAECSNDKETRIHNR